MTNQSHTELAAQARRAVKSLEILDMDSTADLLRQCAAALESPERVLGLGWKRCGACNGTGDSPSGMLACEDCSGSGRVAAPTPPTAPAQDAQGSADVPAGFVLVPVNVLKNASESLGSFVSDHGWSQEDMDAMDVLDAYIAGNPAPPSPQAEKQSLSDEQIEDMRGEANRGMNIERDDYFKAFRDAEFIHGIVTKESST